MLNGMLQTAHSRHEADEEPAREGFSDEALDALLADLISHSPEIPLTALTASAPESTSDDDHAMRSDLMIAAQQEPENSLKDTVSVALTDMPIPVEPEQETTPEPMPARVYSIGDLMLYERLTGYRLVAQRQLWRSVDKDGNRSMAGDRLFTVLAEEAFQLADRQRRNGPLPQSDLGLQDIAAALKPMRAIAAHLGERGHQACDRLEDIVTAAIDRRVAA